MPKINPFKPNDPVPTAMFAGRYDELIALETHTSFSESSRLELQDWCRICLQFFSHITEWKSIVYRKKLKSSACYYKPRM